jgi:integrase
VAKPSPGGQHEGGYRSYLDRHFLPFFGDLPMASILPSTVQSWVTQASTDGLAPRSVVKYHVMLHSVFKRAVRDRVIGYNPCAETELPKVIARKTRILTPDEFQTLLAHVPQRFVPLILTEIETGLRWGELIALRPRHVDFLRRTITVEEPIIEVPRKVVPHRAAIHAQAVPQRRRAADARGVTATLGRPQPTHQPAEPGPR